VEDSCPAGAVGCGRSVPKGGYVVSLSLESRTMIRTSAGPGADEQEGDMAAFELRPSAASRPSLGGILRHRSRSKTTFGGRASSAWPISAARFRLPVLPVVALAFVWAPSGCAWGAEGLVVEQARPGNVFSSNEVVQIPVRSAGDRIDWWVEDFFGTEIANGSLPLVMGRAIIEPKLEQKGYFEVHLEARESGARLAADETAFAVIAPPGETRSEQSPFGVMTHFAQGWDRDIFPLIAMAGIKHIRDEQYWNTVEPEPGRFVFPQGYTAYMAEARSYGIEPLIVMSFANDHYDGGLTPYTDAGREGYARYGKAILDQYGDQIRALEVWNEYNGSFATGPVTADRPLHYTKMLEQAYRQIKSVRPYIKVLGGASVSIPLPYLREIFRLGGLHYMDGVVVHTYGEPEGVESELAALKELIQRYSGGVRKPIWVTEFGHYDNTPGGRRRSASYLVRLATLLLSEDVERMYWYLMRDYLGFQSMGLVRDLDSPFGRYAPAPAYVAYANLIRQLSGSKYVRREPTDPRTHVHVFERNGEEIRASWSTEPVARVTYETRSPLTVVDIVGDERTVSPTDDEVSLLLTQNPVYVKGPAHEVREHRSQSILAWAEQDFSNLQGAGGWYYGYYDGDGKGDGDGIEPTGPYTDDDFELLAPVEDAWGQYWGDQQLGPIKISAGQAHPSAADGRAVWAVRRWVSDVTGTVHIAGNIERGAESDGTRAAILVDGTEVFSADVGGPDGPKTLVYAIDPVVKKGSAIDFAVTPGPGTDVNFDATTFTALITLPIAAASEQDFGITQGLNGWYYGYYDGDGQGERDGAEPAGPYTDDDFEHLKSFDDEAHSWRNPAVPWLAISRGGAHPSAVGGRPVWAVRRWVSDVDGAVRITGRIGRGVGGDGTRALILVDGTEVFSAEVGGANGQAALEYEAYATVKKGSLVDFAVTPGPGTDINYDATTFTATISSL
jgi:Glycosyl hydrolase catalytic core